MISIIWGILLLQALKIFKRERNAHICLSVFFLFFFFVVVEEKKGFLELNKSTRDSLNQLTQDYINAKPDFLLVLLSEIFGFRANSLFSNPKKCLKIKPTRLSIEENRFLIRLIFLYYFWKKKFFFFVRRQFGWW